MPITEVRQVAYSTSDGNTFKDKINALEQEFSLQLVKLIKTPPAKIIILPEMSAASFADFAQIVAQLQEAYTTRVKS